MSKSAKLVKIVVIGLLMSLIVLLSFVYVACFIPEKAESESGKKPESGSSTPTTDQEPPQKSYPRTVKITNDYSYQNLGGSGLEEFRDAIFYGNNVFVFFETDSGDYDCTANNRTVAIAKLNQNGDLLNVLTLPASQDSRFLSARPYQNGFLILTCSAQKNVLYQIGFDLMLQKTKELPYMPQAYLYVNDSSFLIAGANERLSFACFDFSLVPVFERETEITSQNLFAILPDSLYSYRIFYQNNNGVYCLTLTSKGDVDKINELADGKLLSFSPRSEQNATFFYFLTQNGNTMTLTKTDKAFNRVFIKYINGENGVILFDKYVTVAYKNETALQFCFICHCGEDLITLSHPQLKDAKISGNYIVMGQIIYAVNEIELQTLTKKARGLCELVWENNKKVWLFSSESEKAFGGSDVMIRILPSE